jgi:hypothetical protein
MKVVVKDFGTETICVTVEGTSPLIMHKWSEKTIREHNDKKLGLNPKPKREIADPQTEYEAAIYRLEDGTPGFPATAFKLAATRAASFFGFKMTEFRPLTFFGGSGVDQLVPIIGEPKMREDIVRVGGKGKGTGTMDTRWRAEFWPWSAKLTIRYISSVMTAEQVVNIINASGMNGIGEWRPEKDGTFGTFRVVEAEMTT